MLVLVKCVFCGNFYVCSDKCVSIVVKIKCVNSDNISDICNKFNLTTNYTYLQQLTHSLSKHTNNTIFETFDKMVPP